MYVRTRKSRMSVCKDVRFMLGSKVVCNVVLEGKNIDDR